MNALEEVAISCPYCGECFTVLIDCSYPDQSYIEDCQVCCQPITFQVTIDEDQHLDVNVFREDD